MNVSLRPLEDPDLDTIYQQVTDPESSRMAAFTAEDQTDRRAFLNRISRLRADTNVSFRVIDVDGAAAGTIVSFRIDDQPDVCVSVSGRVRRSATTVRAVALGVKTMPPPSVSAMSTSVQKLPGNTFD